MGDPNRGRKNNLAGQRTAARLRKAGLTFAEIGRRLGGLTRQRVQVLLADYQRRRSRLTPAGVLELADRHKAHTGGWPRHDSGRVLGMAGLTWRSEDNALRYGHRG